MNKNISKKIFFITISMFLTFGCDNSTDPNNIQDNDIQNLEFTFISASGSSNLMPPNISDPIGIVVSFEIKNLSAEKVIEIKKINECTVFSSNNNLLGKITMYPYPEIRIQPSNNDTISFYKETNESKLFDTPCDDSIYVKIEIEDQFGNSKELLTQTILYECSY